MSVFCDQSIDAKIIEPSFFFVASVGCIAKDRSHSACESLNTSVCIFILAPLPPPPLSNVNDEQMETEHTLGKALVFCL